MRKLREFFLLCSIISEKITSVYTIDIISKLCYNIIRNFTKGGEYNDQPQEQLSH